MDTGETSWRMRSQASLIASGAILAPSRRGGRASTRAEEGRRPRLVILDMRVAMAENRAVGRTQRGKCEAVGRSPCGDPQRFDLAFEQIGKSAVEPQAPVVTVVGRVLRLAAAIASSTLGWAGAALSEKKRMRAEMEAAAGCVNCGLGKEMRRIIL